MEENPGKNWQAIVLAVFCALVILAFLTGAAITLADGITKWKDTHDISLSLLPAFLTISALLLASALIGRAGWLALGRIRNKPSEPAGMKSFPVWAGILFVLGWVLSIVLAIVLVDRPILQWFSLPFYLLSVGMPVYGLVRLGTWGLNPGSKLRSWGTLSGGMTVAPLLSGIAEGVVLVIPGDHRPGPDGSRPAAAGRDPVDGGTTENHRHAGAGDRPAGTIHHQSAGDHQRAVLPRRGHTAGGGDRQIPAGVGILGQTGIACPGICAGRAERRGVRADGRTAHLHHARFHLGGNAGGTGCQQRHAHHHQRHCRLGHRDRGEPKARPARPVAIPAGDIHPR